MKIRELANLVGVSVRTLHHYDSIGLLVPERTTKAGYRVYSPANLERLQQILFFRELGFSLKDIQKIVTNPSFDHIQALEQHQHLLRAKHQRLETLLETVALTLKAAKGELTLSPQEQFKGFDFTQPPNYEEEARLQWGDDALEHSKEKIKQLKNTGKLEALQAEMNALYTELATLRHQDPDSPEAQAAIDRWYHLLQHMGTYSLPAFKGLGQMYVADPRFSANIDQFGQGLAQFMCDAMGIYADKQE